MCLEIWLEEKFSAWPQFCIDLWKSLIGVVSHDMFVFQKTLTQEQQPIPWKQQHSGLVGYIFTWSPWIVLNVEDMYSAYCIPTISTTNTPICILHPSTRNDHFFCHPFVVPCNSAVHVHSIHAHGHARSPWVLASWVDLSLSADFWFSFIIYRSWIRIRVAAFARGGFEAVLSGLLW